MVETLAAAHARFPQSVVARRVHRILACEAGLAPYNDWDMCYRDPAPSPRADLLATGVGGVLYPSGFFAGDVMDIEAALATCPHADDIWLKVCEIHAGVGVAYAPNHANHPYVIEGSQLTNLVSRNVHENKNDEQLQAAMAHFGIDAEQLVRPIG